MPPQLSGSPSQIQPPPATLLFPSLLHIPTPPAKSRRCFPRPPHIHVLSPSPLRPGPGHQPLPSANPPHVVLSHHDRQTLDILRHPSALSLSIPKPPASPSASRLRLFTALACTMIVSRLFLNDSYPGFLVFLLMIQFQVASTSEHFAEGQVLIYK